MNALLDDLQTVCSMVENATDEEVELMNSVRSRVEGMERELALTKGTIVLLRQEVMDLRHNDPCLNRE